MPVNTAVRSMTESSDVPAALRAEVQKHNYSFMAFDSSAGKDGFIASENAIVLPGSQKVTLARLDRLATQAISQPITSQLGMSIRILDTGIVKIQGASCGRVVTETTIPSMGGLRMRQVLYLLPGHDEEAMLTFAASTDTFASYEPLFAAAVQSTEGIEEPPLWWLKSPGLESKLGVLGFLVILSSSDLICRRG